MRPKSAASAVTTAITRSTRQDGKHAKQKERRRQLTPTPRFDNDMYAHLNNTVYTALFDAIANAYLVEHCGMNPFSVNNPSAKDSHGQPGNLNVGTDQIGLIVSTHADFFGSVSFPDVLEVGLRVAKLGTSSVTWEVGVFRKGEEDVKMVGTNVHVFVLRDTMRVGSEGMDDRVRRGLKRLLSGPDPKL